MRNKLKITVIGGGSSYTPELIDGFITRYGIMPVNEIVLVDIPEGRAKLDIIEKLSARIIEHSGLPIKISSSFDIDSALKGSDFVVTQFRTGGLKARALDEKIPLSHGLIGQETTGAGGFANALRTVPVALSIAKKMEQICPDAWLINFANPSGIVTEAINQYSSIRCIGLCNVPINMEREIAAIFNVKSDDVYCEFVGLNHLSWIKKVYVHGVDRTNDLFDTNEGLSKIVENIPKVPGYIELISMLKLIPSPYLNYYYFEKYMLQEELKSVEEGKGTRAEQVMKIENELFKIYRNSEVDKKPVELTKRGGSLYSEAAVALMESIYNNTGKVHVLNVQNNGSIEGIPSSSVVETNCVVNSSGARPITSGRLPESIYPLVTVVKAYEQLTVKAALSGSINDAFLALLNHPLIHGAEMARVLSEELISAHKDFLPNFFDNSF